MEKRKYQYYQQYIPLYLTLLYANWPYKRGIKHGSYLLEVYDKVEKQKYVLKIVMASIENICQMPNEYNKKWKIPKFGDKS